MKFGDKLEFTEGSQMDRMKNKVIYIKSRTLITYIDEFGTTQEKDKDKMDNLKIIK